MFLTVFYAVVDPKAGRITFANAGHPHAFLVSTQTGKAVRLEATRPPLGLATAAGADAVLTWVPREAIICLFTDGVAEARGGVGGGRARRAIRRGAGAGPRGQAEGPVRARDPRIRPRRPRRLHGRRAARRRPHRRHPQGVIPDKRLGQHFLTDRNILQRIVDALEPAPDDLVVEIGAGKGSLTVALAPRVAKVVAVEKDRRLARDCGLRIAECGLGNVTVVEGDALKLSWHALVETPPANPQSPIR